MAKNIIKSVRVTEKATNLQSTANQYTLEVAKDANAIEVAEAVEKAFKVKVARVNILNAAGKLKTSRMSKARPGIKGKMKKAIVSLKKGDSIQLA